MDCNGSLETDGDDVILDRTSLLQKDALLATIYLCVLTLALLTGTFGNVLILLVSGMVRSVNKVGSAFIVNLAIADLCVAGFAEPMCIIGVVKGEEWFDDKVIFCDFIASLCLTACFCAFLSLTLMSFSRFVYVCHNTIYDKIFTRKACLSMCVVAWITAFLFEFPNQIGWGGLSFDHKNHQCIWDRTASLSYTLFVSVGLIGCPLVLMAFCYIMVFYHIYRSKYNVYAIDKEDGHQTKRIWLETLRTSRMLFVVFVMFVVCWVPYSVIIALDVKNKMSVEVHLFVTLLAHLHSSCNCIIYTICNSSFRSAILKVLRCTDCANEDRKLATKSSDMLKS